MQLDKLSSKTPCWVSAMDWNGDNGTPLIELSVEKVVRPGFHSTRGQQREVRVLTGEERKLEELRKGDQLEGTVVSVQDRTQAAFLDCNVTRRTTGGGRERIVGRLRFKDMIQAGLDIEEEFTEIEDVTDVYDIAEDGTVTLIDEDTGEKIALGSVEGELEDELGEDDDMFQGMSPSERLEAIEEMLHSEELDKEEGAPSSPSQPSSALTISVGSTVTAYVKSVSVQSGRFSITLSSSPSSSLAEEKLESLATKRMNKLEKSGELEKISSARGSTRSGVVVAKSKSKPNVYYVKCPDFPVGVALHEGSNDLQIGEDVQVRIDGVDFGSGQMGLTVVHDA